jgi:hypothetical protein
VTARWDAIRRWRDRLRGADVASAADDLHPLTLRAGLDATLDAWTDDALARIAAAPGRPWRRAVVVTTATVPTAALEWLALLLGRGSEVTWKHPAGRPGLAPIAAAHAVDLPLTVTADRACVAEADAVIVLGSDATVRAVRAAAAPHAAVFGHGHAWSCAWITGRDLPPDPRLPDELQDPWGRVAADAALHDGRGCLSPVVAFTSLPLDVAVPALAEALARAAARWPRGAVHPTEAALERTRWARARVVGRAAVGDGFSVHGLPAASFAPASLPRSVAVVAVPDVHAAHAAARPWARALSTVGTDDPTTIDGWLDLGASRICAPGRMQRPPLDRVHDGVRWVTQTWRAVGVELEAR